MSYLFTSVFRLPDILKICQLSQRDINPQFRKLIHSFAFTAQNIVLNLTEWTLVSIFIPVMWVDFLLLILGCHHLTEGGVNFFAYIFRLSKSSRSVEKIISQGSVTKSLNLILLGYGTDLAAVKRYIAHLHGDIHKLIRKMQQQSMS